MKDIQELTATPLTTSRGHRRRLFKEKKFSMSQSEALAQVMAYRYLVRGCAPPMAVWQQCGGESLSSGRPSMSSTELQQAERAADQQLAEKLRARQNELRALPADLPLQIRTPLAVERLLPALIPAQRALRGEIMAYADRTRLLDEATATLLLRRARRHVACPSVHVSPSHAPPPSRPPAPDLPTPCIFFCSSRELMATCVLRAACAWQGTTAT